MAKEKLFTAKEAAVAVLKKAEEMLKSKHADWGKLHGKLKREGYSDESADKIAGSIKAKVEKSEQDQTPPDGVQKDPNPASPDMHENGNPAPGALPQNQEKFAAELKGHLKLAKFVGRMEEKRKTKTVAAPAAPAMDKTEDAAKMSGKSGMLATKETGNEMGVHTKGNRGASQGISAVGARLRDVPHVSAKEGKSITEHAKESHKTMLGEMKATPKPKLPG